MLLHGRSFNAGVQFPALVNLDFIYLNWFQASLTVGLHIDSLSKIDNISKAIKSMGILFEDNLYLKQFGFSVLAIIYRRKIVMWHELLCWLVKYRIKFYQSRQTAKLQRCGVETDSGFLFQISATPSSTLIFVDVRKQPRKFLFINRFFLYGNSNIVYRNIILNR